MFNLSITPHNGRPVIANLRGNAEEVSGRIAEALRARRTSTGYMARCPAHDDRNPSLSIAEKNGKVLLKCFAGCTQESVLRALKGMGVWASPVKQERRSASQSRNIVATYEYTDAKGKPLYRVARFEPKDFRPQYRTADGTWLDGYGGAGRVLYCLPEVIQNSIVFLVEGEKDADTLRDFGFIATTNAGGANGWRDEFNPFFKGKEIYILPDDDPPGWRRAFQIATGIKVYASWVSILPLPGAKDSTEWFAQGHSEVELTALVEACRG